jgi:type IX secretion system PorP/SprF family membrane protein
MSKINQTRIILCLLGIISLSGQVKAQLNPLAGIYIQNQYLGNPAMAGLEKGLNINMGYRKQWSSIPGAPKTQSLTADYGTAKKVGLGLNIYTDEAGLVKRSRVMGTYSYHLPLNDESQKLRFGLSIGFMDERVMNEQINGNQNDITVSRFNQRETYVDGDFGVAYTSNRLTLQAAIPNLKGFMKKDNLNNSADRSTLFSAVSYKFYFPKAVDGLGIEPRVGFRGVKGFKNILDIGSNFTVANGAASVMAIYHSTQSATFGMGAVIKSLGSVNAHYTTSTAALKNYTDGNFELGLRLNILKKKTGYH